MTGLLSNWFAVITPRRPAVDRRIVVCPCCREVVMTRTHRHPALEAIRMLTKSMEARRG